LSFVWEKPKIILWKFQKTFSFASEGVRKRSACFFVLFFRVAWGLFERRSSRGETSCPRRCRRREKMRRKVGAMDHRRPDRETRRRMLRQRQQQQQQHRGKEVELQKALVDNTPRHNKGRRKMDNNSNTLLEVLAVGQTLWVDEALVILTQTL
tara:strand:- start:512 stop:970 length:459 start_codon:yes stop_codon:yes gene_type:complete